MLVEMEDNVGFPGHESLLGLPVDLAFFPLARMNLHKILDRARHLLGNEGTESTAFLTNFGHSCSPRQYDTQ